MRGQVDQLQSMFCYISPEGFVPKSHPLRPIKEMVDAALEELSPKFDTIYSHSGDVGDQKQLLDDSLFSIPGFLWFLTQYG